FLGGASAGIGACVWITIGHGEAYCTKDVYGVGVLMGAASSTLVICSLSFIHDLIGTSVIHKDELVTGVVELNSDSTKDPSRAFGIMHIVVRCDV
ncbi:hypothetical protein TNIN_464621, partial [Trichonephila inaurata madagascariensis]